MKITNSKGLKLDALLIANPSMHTGVVMCHGLLSCKDNETHAAISDRLASLGIGSFAFDFSAHGKSDGNLTDVVISDFFNDLACAVSYAQPIFPGKLGLYGASFGGAIATMYAATYKVDSLALKCPVVDPVKSWENYLNSSRINQIPEPSRAMFGSKVKQMITGTLPLYTHIPPLKTPTMIVGAADDELVNVSDIVRLALAVDAKEYTILDADHDFSQKDQHDKLVCLISDWFARTLV